MTTWISVDANVLIDYTRERALHDAGLPPTGRGADALRRRLSLMRNVFVARTAGTEAQRNLKKDLAQNLTDSVARRIEHRAGAMLEDYRKAVERNDRLEYVPGARDMYAAIRRNQAGRKFRVGAEKGEACGQPRTRIRHQRPQNTVDDGALCSGAPYRVLDARHGLAMLAAEICATFGVRIVDAYRIAG